MADIVALTSGTDTDDPVLQTAIAVAQIVGAGVRRAGIAGGLTARQAAGQTLRELRDPATLLGVLAADEPSQQFWQRIVPACTKPVIVVPTAARRRRPGISRVLLPLDGTPESAAAVTETVEQFGRAGVDVVALHVFDAATVPRFWDQAVHAHRAWTEEFLARNCAQPRVRLELRCGVAAEHVADVAAREEADLIALGWSRQLDPGRARTVRQTVRDAAVPVMLVPLASQ